VLLAAGLVALFWFLIRVTWVLLFFTLATVLALALNAPVTWLEKRGRRDCWRRSRCSACWVSWWWASGG
jgi:predicted PurR-regulated permease PerM